MSLDRYLPKYHFHEKHRLSVSAPPDAVYAAARRLTLAELPAPFYWMMALRGLPAWLLGKSRPGLAAKDQPLIDFMLENAFALLEETPGREIVLGMVGEYWHLVPAVKKLGGAREFLDCAAPGSAKVAADIRVSEEGGRCVVSTETRIFAQDERARRRFGMYWALISLGSGLIRLMWLGAIKRKAEREQHVNRRPVK